MASWILALASLALTTLFGSRDSRCCVYARARARVHMCVRVCVRACMCVRVCARALVCVRARSGGQQRHVLVLRLLPLVQALCAAPDEQGPERSKSQALPSPLRAPVTRRCFSLFPRLSANALACYQACPLL